MFEWYRGADVTRFLKACVTNQCARWAPATYVKITKQTGRGSDESVAEIVEYFLECYREVLRHLQLDEGDAARFFADKVILEYGPGDLPGVAVIFCAMGASKVYCVDEFPLMSLSPKNRAALKGLVEAIAKLPGSSLNGLIEPGGDVDGVFKSGRIDYLVRARGLSALTEEVDFVYSRAVLEHVANPRSTFADMHRALRPGGIGLHKVDLKSHGLHRRNRLDFLVWPDLAWRLMYSHKGMPNRLRVNQYRALASELTWKNVQVTCCERATPNEIDEIRPFLARPFRSSSPEDLCCLSFWISLQKRSPEPVTPQRSAHVPAVVS